MIIDAPATEKYLLYAIRDFLQSRVEFENVNPENIYIAIDADIIPFSVKFPAIGIMEGDTDFENENGGTLATIQVEFTVIMEITAEDEYAAGSYMEAKDGLFGLCSIIRGALKDNQLNNGKIESALPKRAGRITEVIGEDNFHVLMRTMTFEYRVWEDIKWQE
jgi:hypothetical protein